LIKNPEAIIKVKLKKAIKAIPVIKLGTNEDTRETRASAL
jgi:hypothetical protein